MTSVFISYRRSDSKEFVLRLYEQLQFYIDKEIVFYDRGSIEAGEYFPEAIQKSLESSSVFLVVIGPSWSSVDNLKRLLDEQDFVRKEIARALDRQGNETDDPPCVIPVLYDKAMMPDKVTLPDPLKLLADIQSKFEFSCDPVSSKDQIKLLCELIWLHTRSSWAYHHNRWFIEGLASDKPTSQNRFAQHLAVLNTDSKYVVRKSAVDALDSWWDTWHEHHAPFIMIGEEGDGKSWSVAAWLSARIASAESEIPVIFIPSVCFDHPEDCVGAMAEAVSKSSKSVLQPNWNSRIRFLTKTSKRETPLLVMVVDGLNETPAKDWQRLFDAVLASSENIELRDSVAVIATCRSLYWKKHLSEFNPRIKSCTLSRYNAEELDIALKLRNISRAEFSPKVLEFLTRPRYLDMAVELRPQLEASGADITPELLIYEDWRYRISQKRGRELMDADEFRNLITSIANNYDGRIAQSDLSKEMLGLGDMRQIKDELLTSGILIERAGKYEISKNPMILGFGILLANLIEESGKTEEKELDEIIAFLVGRHSDVDIQVQICAMALFHALLTDDFPEQGRLALFRAWIEGRNLEDEDVERIYNNFTRRPATYFSFAEELWSSRSNNYTAQNIFMATFLAHSQRQNVQVPMNIAFERWYGFVHPLGYRGLFEREQNKRIELIKEVEIRLGHQVELGTLIRYGCSLEVVDDQKILRLAQAAESVISHLDRALFTQALINGAVAAAIMDGSNIDFRWVIRTASKPLHLHLLQKSRELISNGEETALRVAYRLLSWLYSEEALDLRDSIPEEFAINSWYKESLKEDHCNSIRYLWNEDNYLDYMQRTQLAPIAIAENLREVAINPLTVFQEEMSAKIDTAIHQIDLTQIDSHIGQTREDIDLRDIEPAICAFVPDRYAELIRNLTLQLDGRDDFSRRMLAMELYQHLPILTGTERNIVLKAWRLSLAGSSDEAGHAESTLFPMVVFNRPLIKQISLQRERKNKAGYFSHQEPQYRKVTSRELAFIAKLLIAKRGGSEQLNELLWLLSKSLTSLGNKLRNKLLKLFTRGNSIIRYLCMEIISNTSDQLAAKKIINSGWRAFANGQCDFENGWGSILLARFGTDIPFSELATRISPQWLGYAIQERGNRAEEIMDYAERLHTIWTRIARPSDSVEAILRHVKISMANGRNTLEESVTIDLNPGSGVKLVNYTWGGSAGMVSKEDFEKSFNPKLAEEEWEKVHKQVIELFESEKKRGNHWIDSSFSNGNLDSVIASGSTYWQKWIEPVLAGDLEGRRLLAFSQGLYESLCASLLNHEPESGANLFKAIMKQKASRHVDSATDIEHILFSLFEAKESCPVTALLEDHLNNCDSDKALSEIAYLAQSCGKTDWFDSAIQSWISSELDYDKARALRLLGFSIEEKHSKQLQTWMNQHGRSWLMDVARAAQKSCHRNSWAQTWIKRFVAEDDRVKSWAAFRLFLRCADKRFWIWGKELINTVELPNWKKDAYRANIGTIIEAIKENEKKLKDTFIGHEVKENQLWPWMKRYTTN